MYNEPKCRVIVWSINLSGRDVIGPSVYQVGILSVYTKLLS